MKKIVNYSALILVAILLLTMIFWGKNYINISSKTKMKIYNSRMNPTIMVPGSEATQERFNETLASLNKQGKKHSILKLTVHKDNSISYSGQIAASDNRPYIVVAFADNKDSYATIKKQAKWLDHDLDELKRNTILKILMLSDILMAAWIGQSTLKITMQKKIFTSIL